MGLGHLTVDFSALPSPIQYHARKIPEKLSNQSEMRNNLYNSFESNQVREFPALKKIYIY